MWRQRALWMVLVGLLSGALGGLLGGAARDRVGVVSRQGELRGVALGLFASDPAYDYQVMLREIAALGARDVLITLAWYQRDRWSTRIAPWPGRSPSLATYRRTLRQARALGLRVAVMPMVRLRVRGVRGWRGVLRPAGGPIPWFASYRRFLTRIAKIAQEEGATRLAVGSELSSLERYSSAWRALIRHLRLHFLGRLFYSVNWDHLHALDFVDALDEVGVTGYLPLVVGKQSYDRLLGRQRWERFLRALSLAQRRWRRPVFLSEVGYPSLASAASMPWDQTTRVRLDVRLQARLWRVFCHTYQGHHAGTPGKERALLDEARVSDAPAAWSRAPFVRSRSLAGFYAWNWFGFGGPLDRSFSPRGKPAAAVLRWCLR